MKPSTSHHSLAAPVLLALMLLVGSAFTPIPCSGLTLAYEGFGNYTTGANLTGLNGGGNWTAPWAGNASNPVIGINASGLTYGSLLTTPGGAQQGAFALSTYSRQFSGSDLSGTFFFSALYQNTTTNNTNQRALVFSQTSFGTERIRISNNGSGQLSLLMSNVGGTAGSIQGTTVGLSLTSPVLIVGQYVVGTANDSLTVWFNPTDLSDVPGTAAQTLSVLETTAVGGGNFSGLASIGIASTNTPNQWDEIRIAYGSGAQLADVLPVPEPAAPALLGLAALWLAVRRRR